MIKTEDLISEILYLNPLMHKTIIKPSETLCEEGVTPLQMTAFFRICGTGETTMSDIASELSISKQQATQVVNGLEDKRLVERAINPSNRRYIILKVTDLGREYLKRIDNKIVQSLNPIFEIFNEAEKEELHEAIIVIKKYLEKLVK